MINISEKNLRNLLTTFFSLFPNSALFSVTRRCFVRLQTLHFSWARWGWRCRVGQTRVITYNVLMQQHFSWWMRRRPRGCALFVINLLHSINLSLTGRWNIHTLSCGLCLFVTSITYRSRWQRWINRSQCT